MAGLDFTEGSMNWDVLEKNLGVEAKGREAKNYKDDRFWSLSRDENDSGTAIIRLLPDTAGTPYTQRYNHAFQSYDSVNKKKRWYINVSPQSINLPCPASELWSELYNLGTEEGKLEAKSFQRGIKFLANIKVIKDPANKENEGKIFLWEFGPKLKDKFTQALNPSQTELDMGETPKELFNPLLGCNIKLKIKKAAGFLNYDDTTIEAPSSIYASKEEAKEDIINNAYSLQEFREPTSYDSYEDLKGKMKYMLECYVPKSLDAVTFKTIVDKVMAVPQVQTPVQETVQTQTQVQAQPEVQTPVQETPQPQAQETKVDDSLDFLDDL